MARKKKTEVNSTHSNAESDLSTTEQLAIGPKMSEILDRQDDITDTVLYGVRKFRKSRNGNLNEVRKFLGHAYNRDITDLDQDVEKYIEKEMKIGILEPSSEETDQSRKPSRSKRRTRSKSCQTSKGKKRSSRKNN